MLVVFICGSIFGVGMSKFLGESHLLPTPKGQKTNQKTAKNTSGESRQMVTQMLQRFNKRLKLSKEQSLKIKKIVETRHTTIRDDVKSIYKDQLSQMEGQVKSVLTPEQHKEWEKIVEEMRSRGGLQGKGYRGGAPSDGIPGRGYRGGNPSGGLGPEKSWPGRGRPPMGGHYGAPSWKGGAGKRPDGKIPSGKEAPNKDSKLHPKHPMAGREMKSPMRKSEKAPKEPKGPKSQEATPK